MRRFILLLGAALIAAPGVAQDAPGLTGTTLRRYPAEEAGQGVAVDRSRFYAIDNRDIAAYDRRSGKRVARWTGDPARFKHLNSCIVDAARLVCAHSNYPAVPMKSTIETFDARSLRHLSTRPIGDGIGSLTWLIRHDSAWWAGYANYDGKGGEPGRDHRFTTLVRYDQNFVEQQRWRFPASVLARFAPRSSSGGVWGDDGLLYVTGHDLPEIYVLRLPKNGGSLEHLATIGVETGGQAIAWDTAKRRQLWSIDRATKQVVVTQLSAVPTD